MTFSPDEIAKVTPEHEKFCRDVLALEGGAMTGGPYAQYGPRPRVIFPGWTGGGNWTGGAFSAELGLYFINSQDHGMLNKMVKSPNNPNMYVRAAPEGAPASMGTNFWNGDTGWPCQTPPWGELLAVNVNTGDIAWRVPLGSYEALDKLGVPATGTINRGGPIATAGGVVFIAASLDARFRAFDAKTGKVLWTANITEAGRTVPMTYMGRNGKQYVAVLAAGGEVPKGRAVDPQKLGGRLFVFALPDGNVAAPAPGTVLDAENARPVNAASVPPAPPVAPPAAAAAPAASPAAASSVTPEVDARQRAIVERVCADCHSLQQAIANRYTRDGWVDVINEMAGRGAQATDPEFEAIIDYLTRHYGR
jgi:quinoprotein glucose dehydrogenase